MEETELRNIKTKPWRNSVLRRAN